ncbi:hypothetical protein N7493_011399 [Penicillium malachiteum]|uniref:Cytochrome P450 n=1 Tax=Penicillium malachiteum TaxID=1324776 RepID=A0AAD6HC20_9EURO|nr:hypothetical protein N7493_011399 [Penicillium malachiteum]
MVPLTTLPTSYLQIIQVFASIILIVKISAVIKRAYLTPLRKLPGPWYAKWTDYWLKWNVVTGNRTQYIDGLHKTYGHCVRISPDEVSFSDINSHRTLHSVGSQFRKSEWYKKFTNSEGKFDSPGLFAMTDPREHGNRKILFSQQFSNSSIMSKESVIRANIHMAVDKFSRDAHVNGFADIMKWWTFLATDVIAELSFAFNLLQYLPIEKLQVALNTSSRLNEYGFLAIQNHKEFIMKNPDASNCLFSRFLDPTKSKAELSDQQLAQEAGNLIVAGSDTTSISLTFLTYALLRPCNREVRDKLVDEISSLPIDAPAKDIMMLPYLKKVIEGSLRIYGGGPSLPRVVPSSGAMLAGYNIPAGTTPSTQKFTMMRDSEIFHDTLSFNPDRWNAPTPEMKDAYSPFLTGPRTCLGMHLAMFEITCGIFHFLKKCPTAQIAPSTTDESMEFENYFIMAPKGHALYLRLDL